jgi:glycosyltransferase involved in cell wall biosynthesis
MLNHAVDRIRFAGWVATSEVPSSLAASDMHASTSPNEGLPCALLEAMSAGLPSMVSSLPANLQLVDHRVHRLTVTCDDHALIGEALLELLGDRIGRQRMDAAARRRVIQNDARHKVLGLCEKTFSRIIREVA